MQTIQEIRLRQNILDRLLCRRDHYTLKQLLARLNEELISRNQHPISSKETLLRDLRSLESQYNIEIERIQEGRYTYYSYKDRNIENNHVPLTLKDVQKLNQTIELLKDFVGLPHFEWIEEINARIHATSLINVDQQPIVTFEHNPEYSYSLRHFTPLFDYIRGKYAIELTYKKFNTDQERTYTVHPYHLKEYCDRWYLVGVTERHPESLTCFAFDRIVGFTSSNVPYRENDSFDIEEYFDSMVGLTIYENTTPDEVILWVENSEFPYLMSNPIHHSQTCIGEKNGGKLLRLRLYVNFELEMRILAYGEKIRIEAPDSFRERIFKRIEKARSLYLPVDEA